MEKSSFTKLDPVDVAQGKTPILDDVEFKKLESMPPMERWRIFIKYPEYFTIEQLTTALKDSNSIDRETPLADQVKVFSDLVEATQFLDLSLRNKYNDAFGIELDGTDLIKGLREALQQGHRRLYLFLKDQQETITNPSQFIRDVINEYQDANELLRRRVWGESNSSNTFQTMILSTEVTNAFVEFLLNYYSEHLTPQSIYNLIELYQLRKRTTLLTPLFTNLRSYPFSVLTSPESWSYYGEVLKFAISHNVNPRDIDSLVNLFQTDIKKLCVLAIHTEEHRRHIQKPSSAPPRYDGSSENERVDEIMGKILHYANH